MVTCPCDDRPLPLVPDIPAGLGRLPRQLAGFPEFRRTLLAGIGSRPALDNWRAREGDDFGVMILEWCAYVSDVLAFYTGEIANELYLRTAVREGSLRRLTGLIGYSPKPPLAASATLALFAEPGQPVRVPAGTAFRSDAFGDEAPQVFESGAELMIDASLNQWMIAPVRLSAFGSGPLRLDPRTAAVDENQIVLVTFGSAAAPARAVAVETRRLLDGEQAVEVTLAPDPGIPAGQNLAGIGVFALALRGGLNVFAGASAVERSSDSVRLTLDALYPQLRAGTRVVLENAATGQLHAAAIAAKDPLTGIGIRTVALPTAASSGTAVDVGTVVGAAEAAAPAQAGRSLAAPSTADGPVAPFTTVTLVGNGPAWIGEEAQPGALILHFQAVPAGRVLRPAKTELALADLQPTAPLAGPAAPLQLAGPGRVLLRDALEHGEALTGTIAVDGAGTGTLTPGTTATAFARSLRTPVAAFGNLVAVTRGETVEEIMGDGDATQSFQRFRLKKKPLTYLSVPGSPSGRKSTLEVWVDGVRWSEIASLFLAGPADRVYTVRRTVDGETEITFGGQGNGQPLPSGSRNVRARYRYGAGAAAPPAGKLRQVARQVPGLRRALNPLAAFGGDDGDTPADIRRAAPDSALALDRAVSLADFEAIARGFRGILNAVALMAWNRREQRAAVKLWFIPPAADQASQLRDDLQTHLRAIAAPGTPITAAVAVAVPVALAIDLTVLPNRDPAAVEAAALAVLTDAETGLLALRRVPIGGPLFRGDILSAVRAVDGVAEVRGLQADGTEAPFALTADEGEYLAATVVRTS